MARESLKTIGGYDLYKERSRYYEQPPRSGLDPRDLAFRAWNFNAVGAVSFHLRIAAPGPGKR
jgi:hypothetical protein